MPALWVFVGGGTGAVLRWGVGLLVPAPWGTVLVNLIGSFLLAIFMHPSLGLDAGWRLLLGTGMMGGFTTYSTFNLDTLAALQRGAWGMAALQVGVTVLGAIAGGLAGWALAPLLASGPTSG